MHIEFLIEDSSGEKLLERLVPEIIGNHGTPHSWRIHAYKGIGKVPKGLGTKSDPTKRMLLDNLPRLLRGYGRTPGIDAVVIVLDSDERNCRDFLEELKGLANDCEPTPNYLFRLAIEEIEAWYFGDIMAITKAYPRANRKVLSGYSQDTVCGTWEFLADAIYPGGSEAIHKAGWPLPGQVKHEWAERIGDKMDVTRNISPSFGKFRDGLIRLVSQNP